jgi:hypothetical protein
MYHEETPQKRNREAVYTYNFTPPVRRSHHFNGFQQHPSGSKQTPTPPAAAAVKAQVLQHRSLLGKGTNPYSYRRRFSTTPCLPGRIYLGLASLAIGGASTPSLPNSRGGPKRSACLRDLPKPHHKIPTLAAQQQTSPPLKSNTDTGILAVKTPPS